MAGAFAWTLVTLAVLASLAIAFEALRRRILWRMAARNALRRPRQTATVVAGLMIGTAIISAALVAGGSAGSAIRGAVYEALGDVDETVRLDSFSFFPESVYHDFRDDPATRQWFDGIAPNVIWQVAASDQRTGLFEPQVSVIGYDGEADAAFRPFHLSDGTTWDGRGLPRGEVLITARLAELLDARPGDRIELRFTPPADPLVPDVFLVEGVLTSAGGGLGLPVDATGDPHTFQVDEGATSITTVVGWDPRLADGLPPSIMLQLELRDPDGNVFRSESAAGLPQPPVWLNVTAGQGGLAQGTWTLTVTSPLAAQTAYRGAAVVLYPVYDPAELRERGRELHDLTQEFSDLIEGLDAFGEPRTHTVTVRAITDGGRGDQFDFRETVFMRMDEAQQIFDREGQINVIKFSNPGGIVEGRDHSDEAERRLNATLAAIQMDRPDDRAVQALGVHPVKRTFIDLADEAGQLMTGLLLFAGSLTIITGLLLIINIFSMLAEERRSELGMARAVGLSRGDLVRLFLFEGSLYALAAAALGAVLGLGLAYGMVRFINVIVARVGDGFPPIPYQASIDQVLVAFSAGALLTFLTIAVASRRIAGLNIVRAIRHIDEPERTAHLVQVVLGIVLAGAGLVVAVFGWFLPDLQYRFTMQVAGPLMLSLGSGMALRRFVRRKPLYTTLAAALGIYYASTYFLITRYDDIQEANIVGPFRGVILTLCVVILVVYWEGLTRTLGRATARLKRMRAVAVPAFSYPQHKRFRTGMTLAMFAIVLLSIGFFSIFGGLFETDVDAQTGDFDIEAGTTLAVEDLDAHDAGMLPAGLVRQRVELLEFYSPDVAIVTVNAQRTGQFQAPPHHHIFGVDQEFLDAQEFRLLWRLEEYASDEEAYQALLQRDDVVIVGYQYSTNERNQDLSFEVGDTLQLNLGTTPREFTIIGIQEQFHFGGVFLDRELVGAMFPSTTEPFYLFRIDPAADPVETARLLERNYRDVGMNAEASKAKVLEEQEAFRQVLGAMKLFLGLGLIIGVLSLGIVTSRSVIERRQEIGMLRALGFTRNMVRRIFFTEVSLTLALAAVIGLACSIVVTYGLWFAIIRELQYDYVIPWSEIGILLGVSYMVALVATLAPIRRAARVAPAEALRYIE